MLGKSQGPATIYQTLPSAPVLINCTQESELGCLQDQPSGPPSLFSHPPLPTLTSPALAPMIGAQEPELGGVQGQSGDWFKFTIPMALFK